MDKPDSPRDRSAADERTGAGAADAPERPARKLRAVALAASGPLAVVAAVLSGAGGAVIVAAAVFSVAGLVVLHLFHQREARRLKENESKHAESLANLERQLQEQRHELDKQRAALDEKGRKVEESERLKGAFIANMSHEIRTPLNSVLALSNLLRSGNAGALTSDQRKYLEIIERNGQSLLRLISDILDISRIDSGHVQMEKHPADLGGCIQEVVGSLAPLAAAKNLDVLIRVPEDLPAALCDEYRVSQVLTNLLGNAIKFTDRGAIVVSAEPRSDMVAVHVTDSGIGIPNNAMPSIFQEFYQVDQTMARRRSGTGLGLAIASRLVTLMGGQLSVDSAPGVGSKFTFTLPAAGQRGRDLRAPRSAAEGASLASDSPVQPLPPATVLVVEDNEDNLFTVRQALAPLGLEIVTASTGREAIELVRRGCPDLVLMDVQMPGMSGLQATGAIRRLPGCGRVPIVALTAQAMKGDRERILAAGCDDYVAKPIQPRVLQDTVRSHLMARAGLTASPPPHS